MTIASPFPVERGPACEAHEWRHRPAIDGDLHVGAREGDLVDAFGLVERALEPVSWSIFRSVEIRRDRCGDKCGEAEQAGKRSFHGI